MSRLQQLRNKPPRRIPAGPPPGWDAHLDCTAGDLEDPWPPAVTCLTAVAVIGVIVISVGTLAVTIAILTGIWS